MRRAHRRTAAPVRHGQSGPRWPVVAAAIAVIVLAVTILVVVTRALPTPPGAGLGSGSFGPVSPSASTPSASLTPAVSPTPSASPTSTPSPSPTPSRTAAGEEACVAGKLAKLTLAERVGQLVLIGTPVTNPGSVTATVRTYHLGGVFLAGRSSHSAASLKKAIGSLQAVSSGGVRLQIALDQEGGKVQTLSGPDFPTIPSAVTQGKESAATLRARTTDWAKRLAAIGVTLDLAPVADTVPAGTEKHNPPIGALDRQFGSDPVAVAASIVTVVDAVQSTGVLTTLKHFPGLGRVRTNTDTSTGATDDVTTASDPFLKPFISGIGAGSGAVMISLATYPKLDPKSLAAFSAPIVTGLLRQQLGFTGLIVSDDLGAAVAVSSVPVGQRAVRFIQAGGSMALSVRSGDAKAIVAALITAAQSSKTFTAQVAAAATKVLQSKYRAGLLTC